MKPELAQLQIDEKELERLSGLDIGEVFVGGVLGGVYRPAALKQGKSLLLFCCTELIVFVLIFAFSMPIGLFVTRQAAAGISHLPEILQFLQPTLSITLAVMIGWNLYMRFAVQRLETLMHLLDEVDKYNDVILAIDLLDHLEMIHPDSAGLSDRDGVLQALSVTRDSLTSGLRTERLLREHRTALINRYDLIANIEQNLTLLKTLELHQQASEYGQFVNEALQIGVSVHREVQKLSR